MEEKARDDDGELNNGKTVRYITWPASSQRR